jgi:hypothetical protein
VPSTGVAGLALGSGSGWIERKCGFTCDNLLSAEVVTADGNVVTASETDNPELFWGLRGGGGNFGIVTRFELQLHPVGPTVFAGAMFHPADRDAELLERFREWAPSAPDEITAFVDLTTCPPLPMIPAEWHGRKVAAFVALSVGPVDEGDGLVQPFRDLGEPIADLFGPMPYRTMQTLVDPLWPKGVHAYFKATNLARLDDRLIETLVPYHLEAPGPGCELHVHQMGGALGRVREGQTAFGERSMPFVLNAVAGWQDPTQADAHRTWARQAIGAVAGASTGRAYVNFLGDADDANILYGDQLYGRLRDLKDRLDPDNVFRLNQNVRPTTA